MKNKNKLLCEKCEKPLEGNRAVWLELSQTDGQFYKVLPDNHVSQGAFAFGKTCAESMEKK